MDTQVSIAEQIGQFGAGFDLADVSERGIERAKLSILDAIGVALASSRYDFADKILSGLVDLGDTGDGPLIGMPGRLTVRDSMMLNGALIHGIDFDDSHNYGVFHPTASAFPCALGTAHRLGAAGRDLLGAYILAIEVMVRVGAAASGMYQPAGFHPTGYAGVFGCAVGAAWMRGLSAGRIAHAQGIALSAASGSMEFLAEGAWTKRVHPGHAAVAGFEAATLAGRGFVGPRLAYEGRFGLFHTLFPESTDRLRLEELTSQLGVKWQVEDMAVKPYPACHYTHSCADAMFALMADGLTADEVASVVVRVPREEMPIVCEPIDRKRRPRSGYEAKFSIPFTVAASLVTGRFGLSVFEDDSLLHDSRIQALSDRVLCEVDPDADFPRHFSSDVTVRTVGGRELHHREEANRGCEDRPLSEDEIGAKFFDNAGLVMNDRSAQRLRELVLGLDGDTDLRELTAALAGGVRLS